MVLSFLAVLSISLGVFFGCVVQRGSLQSLSAHCSNRDSGYMGGPAFPCGSQRGCGSSSFCCWQLELGFVTQSLAFRCFCLGTLGLDRFRRRHKAKQRLFLAAVEDERIHGVTLVSSDPKSPGVMMMPMVAS